MEGIPPYSMQIQLGFSFDWFFLFCFTEKEKKGKEKKKSELRGLLGRVPYISVTCFVNAHAYCIPV